MVVVPGLLESIQKKIFCQDSPEVNPVLLHVPPHIEHLLDHLTITQNITLNIRHHYLNVKTTKLARKVDLLR